MADRNPLELLAELLHGFEVSTKMCREAQVLTDVDQTLRQLKLSVLEDIVAQTKTALEKAQLSMGICQSWVELNGSRICCESPHQHEGPHQRKMSTRADKQRIEATMTWTLETYLQKV